MVNANSNSNGKKKVVGIVAAVCAATMAVAGSLALFTDTASVKGKTTAGKLAVAVTGNGLDKGDFSTQLKNNDFAPQGIECANPGDTFQISYSINNAANKAMRANDTLTVTVKPNEAMVADQGTTVDEMFKALKAGSIDSGSAIHLVEGKKGVNGEVTTNTDPDAADYKTTVSFPDTGLKLVDSYVTEDNKNIVLVYQGDEVNLDGTGTTNVEKIPGNNDKTTSDRKYTLYFEENAGNEWQGAEVSIVSTISAVQYANTAAGDATLNVSKEDHTVATNAGKNTVNTVEIAQEKVKTDEHGKTIGG